MTTADVTSLDLTAGERKLINQLLAADGAVVSKQDLQAGTGARLRTPTSNPQEVLVGRLRKKLAAAGVKMAIRTVRGLGYRLERTGGAA
jgi:DNA-binding response OmpR family regulator